MLSAPTTYVDFDSLAQLRNDAAHNPDEALEAAATQFEAQLIGMMLKSAREAKLSEGVFDSSATDQYMSLMDQQIALDLANRGSLGLRSMLIEQLGEAPGPEPLGHLPAHPVSAQPSADPATPDSFVRRYAAEARAAAEELGIDPKLLLAQAALETGWGASLPVTEDGRPSHNLFGIKAGSSWGGQRVGRWTLEYTDGVAERRQESFRAYASSEDSFADYVSLVKDNERYADARDAADSESYAKSLLAGGYATDPAYLDKWMSIYHGDTLGEALNGLKETAH